MGLQPSCIGLGRLFQDQFAATKDLPELRAGPHPIGRRQTEPGGDIQQRLGLCGTAENGLYDRPGEQPASLDDEAIAAKVAELEAVAGVKVRRVSGFAKMGVTAEISSREIARTASRSGVKAREAGAAERNAAMILGALRGYGGAWENG